MLSIRDIFLYDVSGNQIDKERYKGPGKALPADVVEDMLAERSSSPDSGH